MARTFATVSSQNLLRTASHNVGANPVFTLAAWFNTTTDAAGGIMGIGNSTGSNDKYGYMYLATGIVLRAELRGHSGNGQSLAVAIGATSGAWQHACLVCAGSSDSRLFLNGGNKNTNVTGMDTWAVGNDRTIIGGRWNTTAGLFFDGSIAEAAIWLAALSDAEVALLAKGYSPAVVCPSGLASYWPLIGRTSPEIDLVGKFDMTLSASPPTTSPHVRTIMPRRSKMFRVTATLCYMRPDADDADGSWTTEAGGTTLYASIDEPAPVNDADYIKSATTPQNDIARVRIADPTAVPAEPFRVRYRYKKIGSETVNLIVRLKEGITQRASWTHNDVGAEFTTATQTLSSAEFASITDFTNLFVEFEADTP